jgi:sortase A
VQLQQVVVEGVTPSLTAIGPGHVPGTAGLGQPGNAVVVGRRGTFGGPFGELGSVRQGDRILVTTTQGQSIYVVDSNRQVALTATPAAPADVTVDDPTATTGTVPGPAVAGSTIDLESVFGRTGDARLTLVSSASASPLNSSLAQIVVAKLEGRAFTPTPQGARTDSQIGTQGDGTAWAPLLLAALAYGAVGGAAVLLYRRSSGRVAYLLTIAPLVAVTIVLAETSSRLLPAWT